MVKKSNTKMSAFLWTYFTNNLSCRINAQKIVCSLIYIYLLTDPFQLRKEIIKHQIDI